jgi:TRAP-type mannitol/chloroaromatic compound transport system permease small subunit
MDSELQKLQVKIDEQQVKIDQMYRSVEKLRRYFKWTMIITLILFVLPLIGLVFALPSFLNNYLGQINSLGGF